MNERSFIVKSDLNSQPIPLSKIRRCRCLKTLVANRDKDAPLRRKLRYSAQRDAPLLFPRISARVQDFVSHTASTACETLNEQITNIRSTSASFTVNMI